MTNKWKRKRVDLLFLYDIFFYRLFKTANLAIHFYDKVIVNKFTFEYERCDLGHRAWPGALVWPSSHVRDLVLPCGLFLPLCRLWDIRDIINVFGDLVIQNQLELRHCDLILINNKLKWHTVTWWWSKIANVSTTSHCDLALKINKLIQPWPRSWCSYSYAECRYSNCI